MSTSRTIKALAILSVGVLLVAAIYLFFDSGRNALDLKDEPLASTDATAHEIKGDGTRNPERSEVEKLLSDAYEGDPTSITAARKLAGHCSSIEGSEFELLEVNRAMEMPDFFMTHLENLIERCHQLSQLADLQDIEPELEALFAEAQPLVYKADRLVETLFEEGMERADEIAQEVILSRNGAAIQHLGSYFLYVDSQLPPPSIQQVRARMARDNALSLLSCRYGWAECARGSEAMLNQCAAIKSESCFRNLDQVGYLETFQWSPAERQDAYGALQEFELMISEGNVIKIIQLGRN